MSKESPTIKNETGIEHTTVKEKTIEDVVIAQPVRIPVNEIERNPKQPRTFFDEQALLELAESIKHHDIIQPITLTRLPSGKYRLISGERRWRAAKIAGLNDVPAYIRQTEDAELLELAILENLQRENLRPMEQATAFRQLAEECHLSISEISMRQGKTEYFIRQQIKLTELLPQWQKIVAKEGLPLTTALQIAVLPVNAQKELYNNIVSKEDEKADRPIIQINQYTLNQYKGLLSEACFDIKDPELDKKAGACTACPFNSACNSLFPEEAKNPKCNNIACFNNKTVVHQNREFKIAKDDPAILLVYESHMVPDNVKKIKSEGNEVLKLGYSDDCKEVREPQMQDWKEFQKWGKRHNKSASTIKKEFKKEEETYKFKKETYDKNLATGKYKKAFVVHDDYGKQTGRYVTVEMNAKKSTAKNAKQVIASGNASIADIDDEIQRLTEREIRNKELDAEKVHASIVQALKDSKPFHELPKSVNRTDNLIVKFLLIELVGYSNRTTIQKAIKAVGLFNTSNPGQLYKSLESMTAQQVAFVARQILLDKYGNNLPTNSGGYLIRKMAESLGTLIPIADFEKQQKEKAQQRGEKVKARIAQLNEGKKKLKKPSGNTTTSKKEQKKNAMAA